MGSFAVSTRICGSIVLILSVLATPCCAGQCETAGSCYITPAGAGAKTGVDWNNANADLPSSLTRGVTYFLAGSTTSYASHVFNDPDSGTSTITIYKAVDCSAGSNHTTVPYCPGGSAPLYSSGNGPQIISGWSSSFGTSAATWTDTPQSDPESRISGAFWGFCSDYYTIDGIAGSTSPTSVGGQGFMLGTQNNRGLITIGECSPSPAGLTNISFNHVEVGGTGPMPYYPVAVTGCSYDGSNATIGIASSLYGVVGDKIAGWTNKYSVLFPNKAASSISPTQVVVPLTSNPCATLAHVALDFAPPNAFFAVNHTNYTETFANLTIQNCYIHDVSETMRIFNGYNVKILHNYLARNRSTPTQHSSLVQFNEANSSIVAGPITVAYNFLLDGTGTSTITNLYSGTLNGLYVYGNIFTCDHAPLTQCGGSGHATVSDNGNSSQVKDLLFYNNTLANIPGPAGPYVTNPNSTGGSTANNLFYNISGNQAVRLRADGSNPDISHDYNTILNSTLYGLEHCKTNETCIFSGAPDPFVNDAGFDFHLKQDMSSRSNSGKATAQGVPLPSSAPPGCTVGVSCYNIDMDGKTRGADSTMARGAYEYAKPVPPQSPGHSPLRNGAKTPM